MYKSNSSSIQFGTCSAVDTKDNFLSLFAANQIYSSTK